MEFTLTKAEAKKFMVYNEILENHATPKQKAKLEYAPESAKITLTTQDAEKLRLITVLVR